MLQRFIEEHDGLTKQVVVLSSFLNAQTLLEREKEFEIIFQAFMTDLASHVYREDLLIYPLLSKSSDSEVSRLARKYQEEMGDMAQILVAFRRKWKLPRKIQQDAEQFIQETNALIEVLVKRITLENQELYPLYLRYLKETGVHVDDIRPHLKTTEDEF